jgi:hypothetical protein
MPALLSEKYEAQAILVYFCSGSSFRGISFGSQTHWRLKLLVNPLWSLGLSGGPVMSAMEEKKGSSKELQLVGKDQSWHLVNWPAAADEVVEEVRTCGRGEGGSWVGKPVKGGAHIDSGRLMPTYSDCPPHLHHHDHHYYHYHLTNSISI